MAYQPGDENKYFTKIIAGLVVIAAAIGFFIYSLLSGNPDLPWESAVETQVVTEGVNPGEMIPTEAPVVGQPTNLPPN